MLYELDLEDEYEAPEVYILESNLNTHLFMKKIKESLIETAKKVEEDHVLMYLMNTPEFEEEINKRGIWFPTIEVCPIEGKYDTVQKYNGITTEIEDSGLLGGERYK